MRFRVGPFDLAAAIVVLVVLFLPPRALEIESAYAKVPAAELGDFHARLARAQTALSRHPGDGVAAQEMADLLLAPAVSQHDQALRVAGEAATDDDSSTQWRAQLALSWAFADSFDLSAAFEVASKAMEACQATLATCPDHERSRIQFFLDELAAGIEAIARGANPRNDPAGFRRELSKIHPTTTFRTIRSR